MRKLLISKKVLLMSVLSFVLLLAACGGTQNTSNNTSNNASSEQSNSGGEEKTHNLIVSHFLPGNHPIETKVLGELGSKMGEKSNGRISFEFYPANSLGDASAHYDMAVTGEADIGLSVYGYTPGRFPLVSAVEMPFLAESGVHGSRIISTLYKEFPEIQAEHSETYPLFIFTCEPSQIISAKYKIETPEDLKGLRVRTPSQLGSKILEALGATPVSMPMGEVYESLQRGVIDAAMVPFETLKNYNFHEITNYITVGNFSTTPFYSIMNKDTYDSFSDSDKKALDSIIGLPMSEKAGEVFDVDGQEGLQMAKDKGAEIIELTGDKLKPWEEALKPISENWIKEMEAKGFPAQEIYNRAVELKTELK